MRYLIYFGFTLILMTSLTFAQSKGFRLAVSLMKSNERHAVNELKGLLETSPELFDETVDKIGLLGLAYLEATVAARYVIIEAFFAQPSY